MDEMACFANFCLVFAVPITLSNILLVYVLNETPHLPYHNPGQFIRMPGYDGF